MKIFDRIVSEFDQAQRRHKSLGFPLAVLKKFGEDQAGHQAALLAYYGFLAIFPLLLVLTSVLKIVIHNNDALREQIVNSATVYIPIVGDSLEQSVQSLDSTGVALVIGLILALFGARGVADAFRSGINHVWQIPYVRRSGFPHNFLQSFGILFVGAFGLILAPLLSGYALGYIGPVWILLPVVLGISFGVLFGMFLALVRIALPGRVHIRELVPAAILAAVGLMVLQILGNIILQRQLKHLDSLYGTFAIVLGLLYWLYLQAQVFFYAIETASVRALRLWPRAVDQKKLTSQDRKAFRLYARRNKFHPDEDIDVTTDSPSN